MILIAGLNICSGLLGFKQYAIIAVIPFLYLMLADGDHRYHRFLAPLFFVLAAMFGARWLWYGPAVFVNSLYYTFGIGPDYLAYNFTGAATNMKPSAFMLVAIVLVSIAMVLPTLVYATASILIHGVKTVTDKVLLLFVLSFGLSLIVRRTPTPGS
jgi:hypothetical protein